MIQTNVPRMSYDQSHHYQQTKHFELGAA